MRKILSFIIVLLGSIAGGKWLYSHKRKQGSIENKSAAFELKPIRTNFESHNWANFFRTNTTAVWMLVAAVVIFFFGDVFQKYSFVFKASLLDLPKTEFTGTQMPVKKVPIWTDLTEAERRMTYDQIPKSKFMDLPKYDLRAMKKGTQWEANNADERNIYITYPVPNLGNYKLDGTENSGSHPGVDIKIPIGTPLHAIANGVVYKVQDKSTGYGKAISIAHINIPDPKNQSKKVTLVSTYAHLSKLSVKEGDKITKGQIIGKSGDTGFATAPHIHFQIDRSDAPFIPYWPFKWSDAQKAGYNSQFEAVKAGFGKSNAVKYTTHPINFIAKFQGFSNDKNLIAFDDSNTNIPLVDNKIQKEEVHKSAPKPEDQNKIELAKQAPSFSKETIQEDFSSEISTEEDKRIIKSTEEVSRKVFKKLKIKIITDQNYIPGEKEIVQILASEPELIAGNIDITSTLKTRANVSPRTLTASNFHDGIAEVVVETKSEYPFKIIAEGEFGKIKSDSLRPEIFSDVGATDVYGNAIKFLRESGVVKGYEDGTFRPQNTLNRAEALKLILESNKITPNEESLNFPDVEPNAWFSKYINTAFIKGIVKGYEDGKFRPGNTISRAEFLKIAILTAEFDPSSNLSHKPYDDIEKNLWYARFFQFAKEHQLLRSKKGGLIAANDPINRGEAADVIYRLSKIIKR